ncbi:MAG: hypothetical protein K2M98_05255, partial [Muribaculum sp.]|nr:hypothetical protein [Muribaculum sp.]
MAVCKDNPAASSVLDTTSISRGFILVDNAKNGNASLAQIGTGDFMWTIGAESWLPIDSLQTVWGQASYTNDHRRNIRWANAVDIHRVGPYVIGDEVGGNLSVQIYDFGGGYARRIGEIFTVGLSIDYRAEIDYRQRDPRLRAIVSDLNLSGGVSYAIWYDMLVAAGVMYNLYNQDDDVDFYSVNNSVRVYPLTGLGTTYSRFSGLSGDFSTAYKGYGWGVNVALLPARTEACRLTLSLGMDKEETRLILRGYNNLNLTKLNHTAYNLALARPVKIRNVVFSPRANIRLDSYCGTENLFGSAVGNVYEQIGSRSTYKKHNFDADVAVNVRMKAGIGSTINVMPSMSYYSQSEKMTASDRELAFNLLIPALDMSWATTWSSIWYTSLNAGVNYRYARITAERLPGLDDADAIGAMV